MLLTGGTGYLGRAIARALARRGHEIVLFARTAACAAMAGVPGTPIQGDVRDAHALGEAAAGCDAVCHTAALVTMWRRRREEFDAVNVGGLRHALAAAQAHGITRITYTSSFLALPPSDVDATAPALIANDYQRTKAAAEQVARDAVSRGVPLVRLYPGVIYGPGEPTEGNLLGRMIHEHLGGRLPGLIGGDRIWSFAYVDDVAEAHAEALERGAAGAAYALGGENLPQVRAFEIVQQLTGRPVPRRIPLGVAYVISMLEELRAAITNATPRLTRGTLQVLRHDWALDSSRAMREIGYRITPFADGIQALLRDVQGH